MKFYMKLLPNPNHLLLLVNALSNLGHGVSAVYVVFEHEIDLNVQLLIPKKSAKHSKVEESFH